MKKLIFLLVVTSIVSCKYTPEKLPILGNRNVVDGDTIYPQVRPFAFINQDSQLVTEKTFEGKIYVVDFFFTHCPTICPKVTNQMLRIYDKFKNDDRVLLLAHSIDTRNDTVARLKEYAQGLGISTKKWVLVTGNQDSIYSIAADYYSVAKADATSEGGFDHSGRLILVDKKRRVRSFCDGTDEKDVNRFIGDIELLLNEKD
jgi:protein SCO1/2